MSEKTPGAELAARLKRNIEREEAEASRQAADRRRQEASARQRRIALMGDLETFGRAVGHLRVSHRWGTLTLRYLDRSLRFKAAGSEVYVTGERLQGRWCCLFEATLARWVLQREDGAKRERVLLFDAGLAALIEEGLGLSVADP